MAPGMDSEHTGGKYLKKRTGRQELSKHGCEISDGCFVDPCAFFAQMPCVLAPSDVARPLRVGNSQRGIIMTSLALPQLDMLPTAGPFLSWRGSAQSLKPLLSLKVTALFYTAGLTRVAQTSSLSDDVAPSLHNKFGMSPAWRKAWRKVHPLCECRTAGGVGFRTGAGSGAAGGSKKLSGTVDAGCGSSPDLVCTWNTSTAAPKSDSFFSFHHSRHSSLFSIDCASRFGVSCPPLPCGRDESPMSRRAIGTT
ncbi:hypothetical protein BC834DRAFT_127255 [Gloeopeniophorella convolvens]|nr:hypothetical protein BC834DRAFT_127255 [Gloeopeniophorella convolvens]